MDPRTRSRLLWAMACLVIGYALLNVVVYFVSGSFGTGWFVASLVVYGAALAGALLLLAAEPRAEVGEPRLAAVQVMNIPVGAHPAAAPPGETMVETPPGALPERREGP